MNEEPDSTGAGPTTGGSPDSPGEAATRLVADGGRNQSNEGGAPGAGTAASDDGGSETTDDGVSGSTDDGNSGPPGTAEDQEEQGEQEEQEEQQEQEPAETGDGGLFTRRRALIGAGLVGLGAIGYSVLSIMNAPNAPPPTLPTEQMEADGWEQTTGEGAPVSDVRVGPVTVSTLANTVQYGDRGLLEAVRAREVTIDVGGQTFSRTLAEVSPDSLDQYLSIFVASRIDLGPDVDNMPLGIGRAEVMGEAKRAAQSSFEETMTNAGLQNVERTDTGTLAVDTGETATLYRYRADFPFDGGTASVLGEDVEIPSSEVEMAGHLAVWHHDDWIMVAAGAHPAENYSDSVQRELEIGQTATVSIDLGLTPEDYREEILGYVAQME